MVAAKLCIVMVLKFSMVKVSGCPRMVNSVRLISSELKKVTITPKSMRNNEYIMSIVYYIVSFNVIESC